MTIGGAPIAEGSVVASGPVKFRVTYRGGDGNDVVLTTLADTSSAVSQDAGATQFGQTVTMTATVSSTSGTPTGSVTFTVDGTIVGTAPLLNGAASLTVSTPEVGAHNFVAVFHATGMFADSTSGAISHSVTRGHSSTLVVSGPSTAIYGQMIRFTATVSTPVSMPSGSATVLADDVTIGTAAMINGVATIDSAALHAGTRSVTARYDGDAHFESSTSPAIQLNIGKAQTAVDPRTRTPVFVGESPLIMVYVSVTPISALVPTGAVSISDSGKILGTQTLGAGAATFNLSPFAVGDHELLVSYNGDADFEASSATIVQSVGVPSVSIHGTRITEGNHGVTSVSLIVTLSAPIEQPVRVSFSTLAGTATEGDDYEKASGVIEFAPGELTRSIELHIVGDTTPEEDETFSVLLSDPVNATIDTRSALVVIANDDAVPPRRRPSRP